jgi:LacI family transcriptional regulator
MIYQSRNDPEREVRILNSFLHGKVDGVIASLASGAGDYTHYRALSRYGMPLVLFDRYAPGLDVGTVLLDDYKGAFDTVEHLIGQGYRRIYHYAGSQRVSIWKNRRTGYEDALRRHGIEPLSDWIAEGATTEEGGYKAMERLFAAGETLPEAVFFAGDYAALGAYRSLREHGLRVPDDMALAGFANEPFCELITPSFTSVEQFGYRMGSAAAQMLLDKLDGGPYMDIVIPPKLIVRESSQRKRTE